MITENDFESRKSLSLGRKRIKCTQYYDTGMYIGIQYPDANHNSSPVNRFFTF